MPEVGNLREELALLGHTGIDDASMKVLEALAARYGRRTGGILMMDITAFPEQEPALHALIAATPQINTAVNQIRGSVLGSDLGSLIRQFTAPPPRRPAPASSARPRVTVQTLSTPESPEAVEHARVRTAVDAAVAKGIVREEIFASPNPTARHGYLLSSRHYRNFQYDPQITPRATKLSQASLFQLMYLLQQEGVTSPVYAEGYFHGRPLPELPKGFRRPQLLVNNRLLDMHDPLAQRAMFHHTDAILNVFDYIQREAARFGMSGPSFDRVSTYAHIVGGHTADLEPMFEPMHAYIDWESGFLEKYREFFGLVRRTEVPVLARWEFGESDPYLVVGSVAYAVGPLEEGVRNVLEKERYAERFDCAREDTMALLMNGTPAGKIPMAYAGKGHELNMVSRLKPTMHLHVLTPPGSIPDDAIRKTMPTDDPRQPKIQCMNRVLALIAQARATERPAT